jgi:hypothetical protein
MMPAPVQNMMNIIQQANKIKQNPEMLATLLQQRGIINEQQVKEIQGMGNNYEKVGQFLMQNGKMPQNVSPYAGQVNQLEQLMRQQ